MKGPLQVAMWTDVLHILKLVLQPKNVKTMSLLKNIHMSVAVLQ